jgi:hypothetical protein
MYENQLLTPLCNSNADSVTSGFKGFSNLQKRNLCVHKTDKNATVKENTKEKRNCPSFFSFLEQMFGSCFNGVMMFFVQTRKKASDAITNAENTIEKAAINVTEKIIEDVTEKIIENAIKKEVEMVKTNIKNVTSLHFLGVNNEKEPEKSNKKTSVLCGFFSLLINTIRKMMRCKRIESSVTHESPPVSTINAFPAKTKLISVIPQIMLNSMSWMQNCIWFGFSLFTPSKPQKKL